VMPEYPRWVADDDHNDVVAFRFHLSEEQELNGFSHGGVNIIIRHGDWQWWYGSIAEALAAADELVGHFAPGHVDKMWNGVTGQWDITIAGSSEVFHAAIVGWWWTVAGVDSAQFETLALAQAAVEAFFAGG